MYLENQKNKKNSLFCYLLLLTAFFMFVEIVFFVHSSGFYLGDFKLVSDHLKIPLKIVPSLAYFVFAQIILHLLFTIVIWSMANLIAILIGSSSQKTEKLGLILWIMGVSTLLLANQYFYADSKFAILINSLLPLIISKILLIVLIISLGVASVLAIAGFIKLLIQRKKIAISGLVCISLIIGYMRYNSAPVAITDAATATHPNIIIIGVDSLRPDFLGYFGDNQRTPAMDQFLNQAAVFSEALTPLARTYPAWVSILTGMYPKKDSLRFNLV